jgi:hypothetical protein
MWRMVPCPNCRALIVAGDRFCGNCGINLNWVVLQIPPQSSPVLYNYQYPNQQQTLGQQQPLYNQKSLRGNADQCQQRYMYRDSGNIPQKTSSSVGGTATTISTEISKLLADFFNKQIKYN